MIIQNVIQCNHCKDVIASIDRHHFQRCICGKVAVDGGVDYLRRLFSVESDYTELSKWDEKDK